MDEGSRMELFILGCTVVLVAGLGVLSISRSKAAPWIAALGVWLGCGLAAVPVISVLATGAPKLLQIDWNMPGGSLSFGLDGLSAFFCLPILLVAPLAALYGCSYLAHEKKPLGPVSFFYNVLTASMLLLLAARNGLLFLIIWEVMAISSFFLVVFDDEQAHVRQAGWTYLIAAQIGTAALLVLFALLGSKADSLDFGLMAKAVLSPTTATILFCLAVIGFGTKAGFIPLHVWLPEAHPAAPSHVSALMSGVMIKTGIYGLLRTLTLLGSPPAAWGWVLVIIGLVSGILGVAFALAQHDLKRLLAYHSVENIGIIALGIGAGLLGLAWDQPALVVLGFGGGILHVLNHAIFKSLLFLGAGAVVHSTGTRDIDHLGGLFKSMRWTAVTFLIASAAISGLPPFNGFISEFLIYVAAFMGVRGEAPGTVILAIAIGGGLALIGGLAAACFAKAFGVVFLGEPRSTHATHAQEVGPAMRWPMAVLAAACLGIGLLAPAAVRMVLPAVNVVCSVLVRASRSTGILPVSSMGVPPMNTSGGPGQDALDPHGRDGRATDGRDAHATGTPYGVTTNESVATAMGSLVGVVHVSASLLLLAVGFYLVRRGLPRGRVEATTGTWDCGYARPTARMQYTASSFAQPLTGLFRIVLGTRKQGVAPNGFFPPRATFETHTPDAARERLFAPLFRLIDRSLAPLRRMQHGRIHEYLLYIAIVLVLLLIWKAGGRS
jgi:formate hydrogenlyase subunit 3/multisubunit Na+/H+ antiporter MnhD subunit